MIEKIIKNIDKSLIKFLEAADKKYALQSVYPILYKSLREYPLRGGKRIRPVLLILAYVGYLRNNSRVPADIYTAALSIELLHDFMLVHDDIIDSSDLRRGKPSLHKILKNINSDISSDKLGSDLAIVAGDILYALAFDPLVNVKTTPTRKEKVLNLFIKTTIATAMGEFIDTIHGFEKLENIKEKDVFLNYTLKTSQYTFACPIAMGAIFAGADKKEIKKLSEFGTLAGQAFQIQDDIIGIFDSEKNIGKSILSDLAESKKTLLVAHAYLNLNLKDKKEFKAIFNKNKKTLKNLEEVKTLMIKAGSLEYCLKHIKQRTDKALKILKQLKLKAAQKKEFQNVIFKLFNQSNKISAQYNHSTKIELV